MAQERISAKLIGRIETTTHLIMRKLLIRDDEVK
jgi:hypothetical protein